MSKEKDTQNIRSINNSLPRVEIKQHPPEIMELDELTVAVAKAKFAGMDLDGIYGDEDRASPELRVKTQAQKIRDLFETSSELRTAFSSEQKRAQAFKDMLIDGIDLEFAKAYCQKKQLEISDEADALIKLAFEKDYEGDANV